MDATAFAHPPASSTHIFGCCLPEDGVATVRPSEMVVVAGVRRTGGGPETGHQDRYQENRHALKVHGEDYSTTPGQDHVWVRLFSACHCGVSCSIIARGREMRVGGSRVFHQLTWHEGRGRRERNA